MKIIDKVISENPNMNIDEVMKEHCPFIFFEGDESLALCEDDEHIPCNTLPQICVDCWNQEID